MPRLTCALTLAGVIDVEEAVVLGKELDRYECGRGGISCLDSLLDGECEFFFSAGYPHGGPWKLTNPLAELLEKLHLSYCFMVIIDGDRGASYSQIVDRELALEGGFSAHHGIFQTQELAEGDPLLKLAARWQEIDQAPPLHLISSGHDAMSLAFASGDRSNIKAYMERRSANPIPQAS